jgi:hypothetical protein
MGFEDRTNVLFESQRCWVWHMAGRPAATLSAMASNGKPAINTERNIKEHAGRPKASSHKLAMLP